MLVVTLNNSRLYYYVNITPTASAFITYLARCWANGNDFPMISQMYLGGPIDVPVKKIGGGGGGGADPFLPDAS